MLHQSDRWIAFSLAAALMIGLVSLAGCKQKTSAPPPASSEAEATQPSPQDDAILKKMREQASTPSTPRGQRNAANVSPLTAGTAPASEGGISGPKELFEAAKNGDLEMVKRVLNSGRAVLVMDEQGSTPMHWAAFGGQNHVIQYLLDSPGFSVNERNRNNVTPLHWAAINGHRDTVDLLVSRGAEIDACDDEGRTPLFAAAAMGRVEVVDYLIQKGADINAVDNDGVTPLIIAKNRRKLEIVKMLTDQGAKQTPAPAPKTTTTKAS